jgi:hypothetical protein
MKVKDWLRGRCVIRLLNASFPRRAPFLDISEAFLVALAFTAALVARLDNGAEAITSNDRNRSLKILFMPSCCHHLYVLLRFSRFYDLENYAVAALSGVRAKVDFLSLMSNISLAAMVLNAAPAFAFNYFISG